MNCTLRHMGPYLMNLFVCASLAARRIEEEEEEELGGNAETTTRVKFPSSYSSQRLDELISSHV